MKEHIGRVRARAVGMIGQGECYSSGKAIAGGVLGQEERLGSGNARTAGVLGQMQGYHIVRARAGEGKGSDTAARAAGLLGVLLGLGKQEVYSGRKERSERGMGRQEGEVKGRDGQMEE